MVSNVASRKKELEKKISILEKEVNDLKRELTLVKQEEKKLISKDFIGKCYKFDRNTYFKVKEVPDGRCAMGLILVYIPESRYIRVENNNYEDLSDLHNEVSEKEFFKVMNDVISYCE